MNLALTVIEIVAPAFLLAGLGFAWVRVGLDYATQAITRLVMVVGLPALLFSSLTELEIAPSTLSQIALAAAVGYGVLLVVSVGLTWAAGLDRRTYAAPLANGNTGNLGLPLALFAFQEQGLGLALVVLAVSSIYVFLFGAWLTSGRASPWHMLKEPIVISVILAAIFIWQGWQLPEIAHRTLSLAGQMSIPLMLITLGVAISGLKGAGLGRAFWLSLIRVVICIVVAWTVGRAFELDNVALGVLVLQLSTPVAVTSYLIAARFEADSQAVAGLVLISTLLSVITLPLTLAFLI